MPGLQEEEMGMTMTEKEEAKQRKKMKALSEDRDADGSGSGDEKRRKKRKKRDDDGATANGYSNKYRREEAEGDSSGKVKSRRRDDDVIEEEGRRNKKPVDESEPFGSEGRWKPEEDVMLNGRRRHYEDGSLEEGEAGIKRWGDPEPSDEGEEEEEEEESDPLDIKNFRLSKPVRDALEKKGIKALFPIQAQTFDYCLDGFDVVGRAKTGQGKTLAFVLPIIESLSRPGANVFPGRKLPSVLVLAPTRELAKQVHADFEMFARTMGLSTVCVYGGASFTPQCDAMRRGVDIVVGTPGRIKDHLNRGVLNLTRLKFRVLDEADEMLNMGFVEDVELILGAVGDAQNVQTLLFSATMPKWVQQIAARFLKPERKMVDLVENQVLKASNTVRHLLLACNAAQVEGVIGDVIQCYSKGEGRTIVFTETKNAATELVSRLRNVSAKALHGDIVQAQREVTLAGFRSGKFKVLVATDVAARGLDIANVELVIQLEPPRDVESYIHRSGRTGRAGKTGISMLICQPGRRSRVAMIERAAGVRFERITPPSSADLAQVSTAGAVEAIKAVPERAVSYFKEAAESLIKEDGAVESLAKALAKIAGHRAALSRSVLTFLQDGVTLHFHSETEIYSPGYVWTCLRRVLSEDVVNEVKGLTLTMDRKGAVFDVPTKFAEQFTSFTDSRGGVWVEVTDSLPELQMDRETTGRGGRGGGMRFGGGGGGGYGRPGGRGGGRGFGSSGGRRSSGSGGRYYGGSRR